MPSSVGEKALYPHTTNIYKIRSGGIDDKNIINHKCSHVILASTIIIIFSDNQCILCNIILTIYSNTSIINS